MNNAGFKDVQLRIDVLPMRVPALQGFLSGRFVALTHCASLARHLAIRDRWYIYRLPHRRGSALRKIMGKASGVTITPWALSKITIFGEIISAHSGNQTTVQRATPATRSD